MHVHFKETRHTSHLYINIVPNTQEMPSIVLYIRCQHRRTVIEQSGRSVRFLKRVLGYLDADLK